MASIFFSATIVVPVSMSKTRVAFLSGLVSVTLAVSDWPVT